MRAGRGNVMECRGQTHRQINLKISKKTHVCVECKKQTDRYRIIRKVAMLVDAEEADRQPGKHIGKGQPVYVEW